MVGLPPGVPLPCTSTSSKLPRLVAASPLLLRCRSLRSCRTPSSRGWGFAFWVGFEWVRPCCSSPFCEWVMCCLVDAVPFVEFPIADDLLELGADTVKTFVMGPGMGTGDISSAEARAARALQATAIGDGPRGIGVGGSRATQGSGTAGMPAPAIIISWITCQVSYEGACTRQAFDCSIISPCNSMWSKALNPCKDAADMWHPESGTKTIGDSLHVFDWDVTGDLIRLLGLIGDFNWTCILAKLI